MRNLICLLILAILLPQLIYGRVYKMESFGVRPGARNISEKTRKALDIIRNETAPEEEITVYFLPGKYDFRPEHAEVREYYISNHDQTTEKTVGIALEDWKGLTIDGNGAEFIFYGTMLPVSLVRSSDCTLKNFSINFENPHIAQVEIIRNDGESGIVFKPSEEVVYRINADGFFETFGQGWSMSPGYGMAFDGKTGHILANTGDLICNISDIEDLGNRLLRAPEWKDSRLAPGTFVTLRNYDRPAPGIFLAENKDTRIENVTVHYAFGMGLLAQLCDGIYLEKFNVLSSKGRYFTTQADATHFSQCKGKIVSCRGVYEGMMDDAINIHGIYLKITGQKNSRTITAEFGHEQAWGFDWGFPGDTVQFINPATMEETGLHFTIAKIRPVHGNTSKGEKEFEIELSSEIPSGSIKTGYGIENLSWTPEVVFSENIVRNNRARGALFSTPAQTIVEDNVFDHTSGSAILLCGDCNGWFESGSCREITIRRNRFINALTSKYQFTAAVISIYPEIPDLEGQTKYFHGGNYGSISITDNEFITFGTPLLYAKSTDGLEFRRNTVILNNDFKYTEENCSLVILDKTGHSEIEIPKEMKN